MRRLFSLSSSLNSRAHYLHQKIRMQFSSTQPDPTRLARKKAASPSLYTRMSVVGDPNLSIAPVLDNWVAQGHFVDKTELLRVIKQLMTINRFKHALEVSLWMADKRQIPITPTDIAIRLKLIHKLFGLEKVENYLNKIPEGLKTPPVYLALLNCYASAKSVDKAEAIMQKARDLGYATLPVWYNVMMNLHYKLGNREKMKNLLTEMEQKCISHDQFTLSVLLSASASDAVRFDKIVSKMESEQAVDVDWRTRSIAAEGYLRMGLIDKALVILNKLELQVATLKENKVIFMSLFKLYGEAGKRDDLYRIWDLYKKKGNIANKVCSSMMRSLMKLDDIEGMEKVFEEWESIMLHYDFEIPNFLIDAYCRDGHLEKAEALITRGISKGGNPKVITWCHLAGGYLKRNQVPEAVEALNKAIPRFLSEKNYLATCLRYLEKGDCVDKAEELINFIRTGGLTKKPAPDELQDGELQYCRENQSYEEIFDQHINGQGSFGTADAKQWGSSPSTKPDPTHLARKMAALPSLYNRMLPVSDPNLSIVPVLDNWVAQGHSVDKTELLRVIKQLIDNKRFKHALEVSLWMTDKRQIPITPTDITIRFKLIYKLFGLEKVENYFKKIPEGLKTHCVYLALLNCYTISKSVDKAEAIMQKARDLGYATMPVWYNHMMNLHCKLGNREKMEDLLNEMEGKGISHDQFTLSVLLSASASASDAVRFDKIVSTMESELAGDVDWQTRIKAAEGYLRMGLIDKALVMLNKLELQAATLKENKVIFILLFKLYGEAGKRDELYRIWDLYKKKGNIANKVCSSMMRSLMKFDDIEGMEKVFEEWESGMLLYDFEIPNLLIDAYCRDGHLEKAEALITRGISKGGKPKVITWCHLAGGYLKRNQVPEAVEALNKAIPRFVSEKNYLATCLRYLEKGDCVDKAEELINFIRTGGLARKPAPDESQGGELQYCGENQSYEEIFDQYINGQGSFQVTNLLS